MFSTYDVTQKKSVPPTQKFFRMQTRRLAVSFETFTGSVAHTRPEKFMHKATCSLGIFSQKRPDAKVLRKVL